MSSFNASRRQFLRTASVVSGSVGAAGAPFALNLASLGTAVAQTAPDYKAIVCLFLYGGNDSSNMILRTDAASFAEYTRMRATGQDPIALLAPGTPVNAGATRATPARLGGVLPIVPKFTVSTENAANTYAVHPSMLSVLMQVFVTFSMIVVLWCLYGYSLAFTEGNAFFGSFEVSPGFSIIGHLGYQKLKGNARVIEIGSTSLQDNITDWKIGVTYDLSGFLLGAAYVGTNRDLTGGTAAPTNRNISNDTVVLSVSKSF